MMKVRLQAVWLAVVVAACPAILGAAEPTRVPGTPTAMGRSPASSPAPAPPAAAPPEAPGEPVIAPHADRLLRGASDYLKAAPQLSFRADIAYDDLLPSGQKILLGASYDAAVRRPDRIYTKYTGDAGAKDFWFDGKRITLYDPNLGVYATEPAPGTIDAMQEYLITHLGFSPPLGDFMASDPYATLRKRVQYGFYVGTTDVQGVSCHHLAFVEQNIDWQIWIEDGVQWVPRKLVITYKTIPGAPQFSAVLSNWDLATRPPDALFTPGIPADATQISFTKAAASDKPMAKGGRPR